VVLKTEVVTEPPVTTPEVVVAAPVTPVVPPPATAVEQLASVGVEPPVEAVPKAEPMPVVDKPVKKSRFGFLWILIAFVLGCGAGFGASKFNFGVKQQPVSSNINSPRAVTISPSTSPTKAPEKTFDRSKVKVKVLNGSGEKGKAGTGKTFLEGLGYVNVATGNADADNYAVSELSIKDSIKEFADKIKTDLAAKYQLATQVNTLAADDEFDVLLIIGQK